LKKSTRYTVNIPQPLYDWICERADENLRSKNGEIVALLREKKEQDVQIAENA
jgi:hypothetical protein